MLATIIWFLASALVVDLAGYWLHRWAHRPGSHLYRAHMTHHVVNYPPRRFFSKRYQSSNGDSLVLYFAPWLIGYCVLALLLPCSVAIIAGAFAVAFLSSVVHDLTHLSNSIVWRWRVLKGIAVRHHTHHFKMGRNFGVLTDLWDRVFRTRRAGSASPIRIRDRAQR